MQWKQQVQKLLQFDVETTSKNPRGELIYILSILKVESTSKFPRRIDVIISTWIRSMSFRRTFHVKFRRRIVGESTRMCPLGGLLHQGDSGQIFCLISSFLSNRRLRVVLDGTSSQEYPVNVGIPEGFILVSTLFPL